MGPQAAPNPGLRRRPSLHVLLIALGLLFAQVPSVLHLLLVHHATCEHGELVEVAALVERAPDDRRLAVDITAPKARRSRCPMPTAAGTSTATPSPCGISSPRSGSSVAAASLLSIATAPAGSERGETRPVPLLALAPKSSPPSVILRNARERSAT